MAEDYLLTLPADDSGVVADHPHNIAPQFTSGGLVEAPAPPPQPGILSRSWSTLANIPAQLWREATTGDGTVAALKAAPIQDPYFTGIAHGARQLIDKAAEKLATGVEAIPGVGDLAKNLPGYQSPTEIRAGIDERQKTYEADPANEADSTRAMLGRATGEGLVTAGPVGLAGRAIGGAVRAAPVIGNLPAVARGLEYLGGTAEAAPGAGLPARLATRGASLAAQGGEVGGLLGAVEADPSKPILPQVLEGAGKGAIAGPVVGSALSAATYPFRAAFGLLPNMVQQNVTDLADRFINQHGIRLDPSQLTQNPTYKLMADQAGKLPLSGAGDRVAQARLDWQGAVARQFGEDTDQGITHAVMDRAAKRIGSGMDAITTGATVQGGAPLQNDLATIAQDIPRFGLTDSQLAPVRAQFRNVLEAFRQGRGQITGDTYQNLTQTGGPLDTAIQSNDPTVAAFAMRIRNALDDALSRSISPGDRAQWDVLRGQYRAMKTVQPLVEQKGSTGDIEPNGLLQRVRAQSARFDPSTGGVAYSGGGPMGDLAYGGQIFFGRPPDSGTAARNLVMGAILGSGGAAGAGVSMAMHDPMAAAGSLASVATPLLLNRGLQKLIRSPAVGGSMVERTLRPPGPLAPGYMPAILPGLLGQ